jgi:hypothetical protein
MSGKGSGYNAPVQMNCLTRLEWSHCSEIQIQRPFLPESYGVLPCAYPELTRCTPRTSPYLNTIPVTLRTLGLLYLDQCLL